MFEIASLLIFLALGFGFGTYIEKRHYRSIVEREAKYNRSLPVVASKHPPQDTMYEQQLVTGSVVISVDYFKRFLAGLRLLFGGRLSAYESLVDRARREAVLRMKEQAHELGARYVFNIKFETASISKGAKGAIGSVEVLAYGTAMLANTLTPQPA